MLNTSANSAWHVNALTQLRTITDRRNFKYIYQFRMSCWCLEARRSMQKACTGSILLRISTTMDMQRTSIKFACYTNALTQLRTIRNRANVKDIYRCCMPSTCLAARPNTQQQWKCQVHLSSLHATLMPWRSSKQYKPCQCHVHGPILHVMLMSSSTS